MEEEEEPIPGMEFFDLSKPLKPIVLKGGQTKGVWKVEGNLSYGWPEEKNQKKGTEYVKQYFVEAINEQPGISENTPPPSKSGISSIELSSFGTSPDVRELEPEKNEMIYETYFKDRPKPRCNLLIESYKEKILSMIMLNQVTVIAGPTGCGKTTQVPQYILDYSMQNKKHCNIVVTQPRRIAAITISKRVCDERKWAAGTVCGYKVGLINSTSEDTRLTYVTVGVLVQTLISSKNKLDYTHVILDEVHERDSDLDFVLLIFRKFLMNSFLNIKLVLMSATADVSKFARYFQKRILNELHPAPVLQIRQKTNFPVKIHYIDNLYGLGDLPDIRISNPCIFEESYLICVKLIKQFDVVDPMCKSSVLVFLPGIFEIEEMYNMLKFPKSRHADLVDREYFVVPLHSSITTEEQSLAFVLPPRNQRKVILATNIAESSITVPDVVFVIDFCLTKVLVTDRNTNLTSLQLTWASKANCIQRAGRAGRVKDGRVYRLVPESIYKKFSYQSIPDMLRCPLEKIVLQSKILDIGPPMAVLAQAMDPPDLSDIEATILTLKEVGGLLLTVDDEYDPYDGDLTRLGRLMALMPVDIYITKLIALGHVFSCLEECIIIGASMSLRNFFSTPFQGKLKAYDAKLEWADGSCSDCVAFLNAYQVWRLNHTNGYFERLGEQGEIEWAKRNFIQLRPLREVHCLVEDLTQRLKKFFIEKPAGSAGVIWTEVQKNFIIKVVIAGAFYPHYFNQGHRNLRLNEKEAVNALGGRNPFSTVYLSNYPKEQPPELYSHLIKEKLADCKDDMRITYDSSSKVYIEFRKNQYPGHCSDIPFSSEVPGKITMAVFRAVKLRQTLRDFEIKVMPVEQAVKEAERMGIKPVRSFTVRAANDSVQDSDSLFQSMVPGVNVSLITLNVTHVVNPSHFYAASKDAITHRRYREVFNMLNEYSDSLLPFTSDPEIGEMCVAPYEEEGTWFYRARVEGFVEREKVKLARVYFIDYGNCDIVPVRHLKKYSSEFKKKVGKIPALCFKCTLSGIKPSLMKNPSGKWSQEAVEEFTRMTTDVELIGYIFSVVDFVVSLELHRVSEHGAATRQVNINQHLVQSGLSEVEEESFLSKVDNEMRTTRQLDLDSRTQHTTFHMYDNWRSASFEPPKPSDCNVKISLQGPFSPLEMKMFSLTASGAQKRVYVSHCSVNSVLLDSDPSDPHDRLLVAAFVSQNYLGNIVTLQHTTLLPNIHGITGLIPFIFSPTAELRVDKKKTHYTGILCGLGANAENKSLYPDHDMDIVFDVEFSFEDYCDINKLRFYMSLIFATDLKDDSELLTYPDIIEFQTKIKKTLLTLLDRPRPYLDITRVRDYAWGTTTSDVVLSPVEPVARDMKMIFRPHPGIHVHSNPEEVFRIKEELDTLRSVMDEKMDPPLGSACPVCLVALRTFKDLQLHFATETHKSKEQTLMTKFNAKLNEKEEEEKKSKAAAAATAAQEEEESRIREKLEEEEKTDEELKRKVMDQMSRAHRSPKKG